VKNTNQNPVMTPNKEKFNSIIDVIRSHYPNDAIIPLYKSLVLDTSNVTEVLQDGELSTASGFVDELENELSKITGAEHVVALNSGTSALHMALVAVGVEPGDLVLTQALSFVATGNSILYAGASPVFIDVENESLGIDLEQLQAFLSSEVALQNDKPVHVKTGKRIAACVPMHTLGFPSKIEGILKLCRQFNIPVIEDAAESFGSEYKGQFAGTFGDVGCLSFNGNKIVTAGSGGAVLCKEAEHADRIRHLSSTAKQNHTYEFNHNELGYNIRMAGINAALLLDQLKNLDKVLEAKRALAKSYKIELEHFGVEILTGASETNPNYWLNTIQFNDFEERTEFLDYANAKGVLCRPIWKLLSDLPHFQDSISTSLKNSQDFYETLVSLPSYITKQMFVSTN
jgi:aminotransferase in exopolysaccharide biosynthesis